METREYNSFCEEFKTGYRNVISYFQGDSQNEYADERRLGDFFYFKISEIGYFDENYGEFPKLLLGLYGIGISFSVVFRFDGGKIHIYIGAEREHIAKIYRMMNGIYLIFSQEMESGYLLPANEVFQQETYRYSGILRGNYQVKKEDNQSAIIDQLISGCFGSRFSLVILAKPFEKETIIELADAWKDLQSTGEMLKTRQVSIRDDRTVIGYSNTDYDVLSYLEIIENFHNMFSKGVHSGLWNTTIKYYAEQEETAEAVSGMIIANTFSEEFKASLCRIKLEKSGIQYSDKFLENIKYLEVGKGMELGFPVYSSILSNEELGRLVELPHLDNPGVLVKNTVNFGLFRKENTGISLGKILYKGKESNQEYKCDSNEFIRHALVVGLTGSGKTNTLKNILLNLYKDKKRSPFMVIEPAKREYWELYKNGCDNLRIFSIGTPDNTLSLNPFERVGKIPLQTHIDSVFAAFKASFIMYTPMPYVLEQAIYGIYEDCGWNIEEDKNRYGNVYPTIENLYHKIPVVVREMGYEGKMQNDLVSSLQARINSLRIGIKGNVLNVKKSYPVEEILKNNTIIELENIGDDEVKAFIMSILLISVSEFRIQQEDSQREIRHLILIEEAHRLLKNVKGGTGENADPRGNAVDFFCNMLAELRSKGQAFIIADQIPSKLAPDIIDNTNLKIVHRLATENERQLIGKSMNMNEKQIDCISTFRQGVAAVYGEGDEIPKLIKPDFAGSSCGERSNMSHHEVCRICTGSLTGKMENQRKAEYVCSLCPFVCETEEKKDIYQYFPYEKIVEAAERLKKDFRGEQLEDILVEVMSALKRQTNEYEKYTFCFLKEVAERMKSEERKKGEMYEYLIRYMKEMEG